MERGLWPSPGPNTVSRRAYEDGDSREGPQMSPGEDEPGDFIRMQVQS